MLGENLRAAGRAQGPSTGELSCPRTASSVLALFLILQRNKVHKGRDLKRITHFPLGEKKYGEMKEDKAFGSVGGSGQIQKWLS